MNDTGREQDVVCVADDNVMQPEIKLDETITDCRLYDFSIDVRFD